MIPLVATVFLASLMGSLHCAGMCGVFVAMSADSPDQPPRLTMQAAYHLGRLVTYVTLGTAAGWLGSRLDLGGAVFGIQRVALLVAGVGMILFGLSSLMTAFGVPVGGRFLADRLRAPYIKLLGLTRGRAPWVRSLAMGLLSTLLPCGWLYAFVVAAGGTGSALWGGATMILFWSGTLPILGALGLGLHWLSAPMRRRAPALVSVALVLVGVMAVAGRWRVPALSLPEAGPAAVAGENVLPEDPPACHTEE